MTGCYDVTSFFASGSLLPAQEVVTCIVSLLDVYFSLIGQVHLFLFIPDSSTAFSHYILPLLEESTGIIWVIATGNSHETNAKSAQQSLEFAMARQSVMKRLSSYEPFNKMADAVLYGGIVALIFGSMRSFNKLEVPVFSAASCLS